MILRVRKYAQTGYQGDANGNVVGEMPITVVEATIVADNPEEPGELVLGRLFFSDELLERFCSVITLELEEDYVGNAN